MQKNLSTKVREQGQMETPASLLERLRTTDNQAAWERFVSMYAPLIYYWARRLGTQADDSADLVQDVFAHLVKKMPLFVYDKKKSFRGWLRTVTLNRFRERQRKKEPEANANADDVAAPRHEELWEAEYRQHVAKRALELMKREFQPNTWKACWEHVVSGRSAVEVAAELGMTPGAVYVAKSRVLRRLREELDGLLD